jgi:hypothetical protein
MIPEAPPNPIVSAVSLDAAADAQGYSRDALEAAIDAFADVADDTDADEVERYLAGERLGAFLRELARRDRVARLRTGTGTKSDQKYLHWKTLTTIVRERCETPDILRLAGVDMRPAGRSRGRAEWCGPCPVCGTGDDRLRAWSGPGGRLWCRVCRWSGDVITAASLITNTGQFRDAVGFLADLAAVEGRVPRE